MPGKDVRKNGGESAPSGRCGKGLAVLRRAGLTQVGVLNAGP
jgi:hypothetical protein